MSWPRNTFHIAGPFPGKPPVIAVPVLYKWEEFFIRRRINMYHQIKHILSVIHYTICGAVWFQFTHFLHDDWENIHTLSYYHHQIGSMNYYPLFRVRSWNNGMRCMSFYILITREIFHSLELSNMVNFCQNTYNFDSTQRVWSIIFGNTEPGPILSLAWSELKLCSANHRSGYWSNLPCDWPSTAWAYSEQETENRPSTIHSNTKPVQCGGFIIHGQYSPKHL